MRTQIANSESAVRTGRLQSIPSSNIDSCARVNETVPLSAFGQMNRPRSSRFANKQSPSPSNHKSLIRSPRRPRKTNTCPSDCTHLVVAYLVLDGVVSSFSFPSRKRSDLFWRWLDIKIFGSVIGTISDDSTLAAPLDNFQIMNPDSSRHFFSGEHSIFA